MLVYLAIAIDRNTSKNPDIEATFRKLWEQIVIYSPSKAFTVVGHGAGEKALVAINKYALSQADVVIVYYTPGVESWGVPVELAYAKEHNKPIYLLQSGKIDYNGFPIYLRDMVDREHCFGFDNEEQLCSLVTMMENENEAIVD